MQTTNEYDASLPLEYVCSFGTVFLNAAAEMLSPEGSTGTGPVDITCEVCDENGENCVFPPPPSRKLQSATSNRILATKITRVVNMEVKVEYIFPPSVNTADIEKIAPSYLSEALSDTNNSDLVKIAKTASAAATVEEMKQSADPSTAAIGDALASESTAFGDPEVNNIVSIAAEVPALVVPTAAPTPAPTPKPKPPKKSTKKKSKKAERRRIIGGSVGGTAALLGLGALVHRRKRSLLEEESQDLPLHNTPLPEPFDGENVFDNAGSISPNTADGIGASPAVKAAASDDSAHYGGQTINGDLANLEKKITLGLSTTSMASTVRTNATSEVKKKGQSTLKTVFAPAGKLSVVVDSSTNGPCVHSIRDSSPLLGLVSVGDKIVSIDSIDTTMMSAGAVTKLMARKANQAERKIVFETKERK
jgi:hypothetical protein